MKNERSEQIRRLEEILEFRFQNPELLDCALTHRSYANENAESLKQDNERFEFLGDAVLTLCVSDFLMKKFPQCAEGELSKIRSSIVNEHPLAQLARRLGVGDYLLLGKGEELSGGRRKSSILADAMEAIIAAVFLDSGFEGARGFISNTFRELFESGTERVLYRDYKTTLQEITQNRFKLIPRYTVIREFGPDHDKVFQVKLTIGDVITTSGLGRNKKEAEQRAAHKALDAIRKREEVCRGAAVKEVTEVAEVCREAAVKEVEEVREE